MNEFTHQPRSTTQSAEGIPRLRWTLAEFERLTELGMFGEDDRIELVGGELIPMSPKGVQHEVVKGALVNWLRRNLPNDLDMHVEPGWRPQGIDYVEPDFLIGPAGCNPTSISPADIVLIVEVAHSSLKLDTTVKAETYARHGVPEYWVVNAHTLTTRVHQQPSAAGYQKLADVPSDGVLHVPRVPSRPLCLRDLSRP